MPKIEVRPNNALSLLLVNYHCMINAEIAVKSRQNELTRPRMEKV